MAITQSLLTAQMDTANLTTYTTASVSPSPNQLVLIAILTHVNTGVDTFISTVTGAGMTWQQVAQIAADNAGGGRGTINLWRAMEASPGSGTLSLTASGACISCGWSVRQFDGVDTSGTFGSGAIAESNTNRANTGATGSVTLADFDSANALYGTVNHTANEAIGNGAGFAELDDLGTADGSAFQTQWMQSASQVAVDWTFTTTTVPWGAIAVEIKAAAAPPPVSARESRGRIMTSRGTAW